MTQGTGRMKIESMGIQATIEKAQLLVRDDKQLSAATKSMFEILKNNPDHMPLCFLAEAFFNDFLEYACRLSGLLPILGYENLSFQKP
jgi:hypothetical protein